MALSIIYAFPSCASTLKHKSESHFCFALVETWQSDCIQTQHCGLKNQLRIWNWNSSSVVGLGDVLLHFSICWFRNQDGLRAGILSSHTAWCPAISLDDGTLIARVISVTKQNTSNPILEPTHTRCCSEGFTRFTLGKDAVESNDWKGFINAESFAWNIFLLLVAWLYFSTTPQNWCLSESGSLKPRLDPLVR